MNGRPRINIPLGPVRYHAVSMELAAYLDEQYVEMHILTDTGKKIAIVCDKDSIFAIQRHIAQMGRVCPEISSWKSADAVSITQQ
jgi:hypothetical protein